MSTFGHFVTALFFFKKIYILWVAILFLGRSSNFYCILDIAGDMFVETLDLVFL